MFVPQDILLSKLLVFKAIIVIIINSLFINIKDIFIQIAQTRIDIMGELKLQKELGIVKLVHVFNYKLKAMKKLLLVQYCY